MTFLASGDATAETVLRGWEPCVAGLTGPDLASDPTSAGRPAGQANNLLFMDGPEHRDLRRLVAPTFARAAVDAVAVPLRRRADELVAALARGEVADAVSGVAEPLVLEALFTILGVPAGHWSALAGHARAMVGLLEPDLPHDASARATTAALRATAHFDREARLGRAAGLHRVLEDAAARGEIRGKLARSTPVVVIHGGHENPLNFLGVVLAFAAAEPDRFRELAARDRELLVEELLRVSSPVRRVARWSVGERGAGPGTRVWVDLASANHDDGRIDAPDVVDVSHRRRHLGFGHGVHACPGAVLARLEGLVLVDALAAADAGILDGYVAEWHTGSVAAGPRTISRSTP